MAHLLFIDESGQDRNESPYEVLGGIAIQDANIWPLIIAIQEAEIMHFGARISRDEMELKAKKLLKSKTFKLSKQLPPFDAVKRTQLAREALREGAAAKAEAREAKHSKVQLTALAQAKIAFCSRVLELCAQHRAKAFASIVPNTAPRPATSGLRKDYAYLFERFFLYLDEKPEQEHGIVVFDELERSQSHILINQMAEYFQKTQKGRLRSSRVLPEPMFVHSDLTSLIQVADLLVYIISWGVRIPPKMDLPARLELVELAEAACYDGDIFERWSFVVIDDLRPRSEKPPQQK
jgi:hypothetical protein